MGVRWITAVALTGAFLVGAAAGYGGHVQQLSMERATTERATHAEQERRARDEARVEAMARPYFDAVLFDPESLRLRGVFLRGVTICGEYNAKARAGGYGGFRRFILSNGSLETFKSEDDRPVEYYERAAFDRELALQESLWTLLCETDRDVTETPPPRDNAPERSAAPRHS